ncbi:MAG: hypothetical protein KDE20_19160, partial [Caldilineaceae bacterium]|nr:hypothetical protein [Caldilineaceae bacterium]
MSGLPAAYEQLTQELRQLALLRSCGAVLGWDEQTYLPRHGAEHRAEQLALLAGLSHERATSPLIAELLAELNDDGAPGGEGSPAAANVHEARRSYERATKLPRRLVEELSRVGTLAQQAWVEARKADNFDQFRPWLEQTIQLKIEEAQALGSESGHPYDALLEDYEPGATAA